MEQSNSEIAEQLLEKCFLSGEASVPEKYAKLVEQFGNYQNSVNYIIHSGLGNGAKENGLF